VKRIEFNLRNFAFNLGLSISISLFLFQTTQSWFNEGIHGGIVRWIFPSLNLLCANMLYFYIYFFIISKKYEFEPTDNDPYKKFADGVISYGQILHRDKRDPALLRLRNNSSLTLHVLGFHSERIQLGNWALEAAQFVEDRIAIMSILIDDLGWAKYLVNDMACIENINKAIEFSATFSPGIDEPKKSLLTAKAHRHLGVINSTVNSKFEDKHFDLAEKNLHSIKDIAKEAFDNDMAHIKYARALAVASSLGVNVEGKIRSNDSTAQNEIKEALNMLRVAKEEFKRLGDQGRHTKSMVLEVRFLEATDNLNELNLIKPLCERAVSASVWSRPQGRTFITGR
jgi:hypothetical protein